MSSINSLSASLFNSQSSAVDSNGLINLNLTGTLGGAPGASPLSASALYQQYEKNNAALYEKFINSPKLKAEIEQFKSSLNNIKTVDEVFQNPRIYKFLTTALGIPNADRQVGLVKRALTSYAIDPAQYKELQNQGYLDSNGRPTSTDAQKFLISKGFLDPQSSYRVGTANQLSNPVYANAAQLLQLAQKGVATIKSKAVIDKIVAQYQQVSYEADINTKNSTVQLARYFVKTIPTILSSAQGSKNVEKAVIDGLLADKNVRNFIQIAFNIPQQIAVQPLNAQEKVFGNKVDVARLRDPAYINRLVKTFLTQADYINSGGTPGASGKANTAQLFS